MQIYSHVVFERVVGDRSLRVSGVYVAWKPGRKEGVTVGDGGRFGSMGSTGSMSVPVEDRGSRVVEGWRREEGEKGNGSRLVWVVDYR